eukprot:gene26458-biopygen16538
MSRGGCSRPKSSCGCSRDWHIRTNREGHFKGWEGCGCIIFVRAIGLRFQLDS